MRRVWLSLLALSLAGCATLPWPHATRRLPSSRADGWMDLRGAVHVHTRGSHDSPGTLAQVIEAAANAGLSWVALTEHTRPGVPVSHGYFEGITIVPGYEINVLGGTILALGLRSPPPRGLEPAALLQHIHREGGLAFVGHMEASGLTDPERYRGAGPDGIELVNLHAQALEHRLALLWRLLLLPRPFALRALLVPPSENLRRWERLPDARAIVGGVDAHAKFRALGPLGPTLDRYRDVFRLLTTHVLVAEASPEGILDALRHGRSYVAFEGLERVDSFEFEWEERAFVVRAPRVARLALVCDGRETASQTVDVARLVPPPLAHQCRAEAWLGNRLWIVTSHRRLPDVGSLP